MQNNRAAVLAKAKQPAQEFAVALVSVAAAALIRLPLSPEIGTRAAFVTFFPAIILSAWLGGWRGGLTATALSALVLVYFLIPPLNSLLVSDTADQVSLVFFFVVGVAMSALGNLQREREHELTKSEARYRLLLETANEGALRTDAETRITFINARMASMLGYSPEELIGRTFDHLLFSGDNPQAWGTGGTRQPGTSEQFELRLRHRENDAVWALVSATVIREADQFVETFGLFTDITDRKKAEERLDAAYRRETNINRIGQAVRNTSNAADIQSAAVRELGVSLNVDRAYYNGFDLSHDVSWIEDDYRRDDLPSLKGTYRLSDLETEATAFYPDGKTLILPDTSTVGLSDPLREALRSLQVRSCISVPLFDNDILVGSLAVAMADEPREWTPEEVALVESIAVQTRSALDLSRVHQREHRIASELQNALLPASPEKIPGLRVTPYMKPALDEAAIGGDFFDVFALDERHFALVIGDVSGKGLAAAAQLALVRNSLRTTLYICRSPGAAVSQLNEILTRHDLLVGFVTAFVSVYDSETGLVTYVGCGHEPGLVRRATTGAVEELETTSPPLGISDAGVFVEAVTTLHEGDVLFLYTDGLSEAGPTRRLLLGTKGLKRLLATHGSETDLDALAKQLVKASATFAEGTFRDDVCLLLTRRNITRGVL